MVPRPDFVLAKPLLLVDPAMEGVDGLDGLRELGLYEGGAGWIDGLRPGELLGGGGLLTAVDIVLYLSWQRGSD